VPEELTHRQRPPCAICGGELRFSHREYAGRGRSVAILRCIACGGLVRGELGEDSRRSPPPSSRRRPMPDGGHPDNYVLDAETADRLLRSLDQEDPGSPRE